MRKSLESLFDHDSVTGCLEETKRLIFSMFIFYPSITWTCCSVVEEFFSNFSTRCV